MSGALVASGGRSQAVAVRGVARRDVARRSGGRASCHLLSPLPLSAHYPTPCLRSFSAPWGDPRLGEWTRRAPLSCLRFLVRGNTSPARPSLCFLMDRVARKVGGAPSPPHRAPTRGAEFQGKGDVLWRPGIFFTLAGCVSESYFATCIIGDNYNYYN